MSDKGKLTANKLHRITADIHIPSGGTAQTAEMSFADITGEIPTSATFDLSGDLDKYVTCTAYFYFAADVVGTLQIGFNGNFPIFLSLYRQIHP